MYVNIMGLSHGLPGSGGGGKLFHEQLLARIEMLNLQAADIIVVVSTPMRDELVRRGIESGKILVNPNGVNPEIYSPEIDGTGVRDKFKLAGKTVIGFVGTFGKWHGAEVLAEAFGCLLRDHPKYASNVHLLMIGDGATMPAVLEILRQFGVEANCTLTGLIPQDQGPEHMAACDILASPHVPNPDGTPFFGSPTKLFEYMAMGKAIVASDLEQVGDVLEHGKTALLVRPGDPMALSEGLKRMVDTKSERWELGKAARQEVVGKYTWHEHVRRITDRLLSCT